MLVKWHRKLPTALGLTSRWFSVISRSYVFFSICSGSNDVFYCPKRLGLCI